MTTVGRVAIVGAGPGDPGLVTLAAVRELAGADVVLYDALVAPEILDHARPDAERCYTGKRAGQHALSQAQIETLMVERALAGQRVVRLKGGDPFVFGRGGEEALACRAAGVPFVVVPGISSAFAAPAYAGIPVTHRGRSSDVLVMTGHQSGDRAGDEDGREWAFAAQAGTLVVLMGVEQLPAIVRGLLAAGKPAATPVAVVRWGTRADQQQLLATLETIERAVSAANLGAPAVLVIGEVAALAGELGWFEPGPLAGRRIVVARARAQSSELAGQLRNLGAHVAELPSLAAESRNVAELAAAIEARPAWLVLPSAAAVDALRNAIRSLGRDVRILGATRIAAFGRPALGALAALGLTPDFEPSRATLAAAAAELPIADGDPVVIVTAEPAAAAPAEALASRGATVRQVAAYRETPLPLDDQQRRELAEAGAILFSSVATVDNLAAAVGEGGVAASVRLLSIGPQTSRRLRDTFGRVDAEAATPNSNALLDLVRGGAW